MNLQVRLLFSRLLIFFVMITSATLNAQTDKFNIQGNWLGELVIPNQISLRMGIIVSLNNDNSYKAGLNIIDQATGEIPCDELIFTDDTLTVRLKRLGIIIKGPIDATGTKLNCEYKQAGATFPVIFTRVDKLPELLRPQEPKAPFPYKVEEVVFENKKAGVKLAGTLTIPEKKGKYAAVILVTGSGKQNRNEEFAKHKPFWVIADYLTRKGIVVLRYDDRGTGESSGDFNQATTGDFADDVLAAISWLQNRKEVNSRKIGIIGHSEGGIVASVVASGSSDVAFIVSLAGFMKNFEDVVIGQMLDQSRQRGKNPEDIELEKAWRKSVYGIAKENTDSATAAKKLWDIHNKLTEDEIRRLNWPKERHNGHIKQVLNPWWRYSLALDNQAVIMKVNCPVLALYGALDMQVKPDENIPFVDKALREGGNKSYEIKKLPGLNHMFQTAVTGQENEYFRIEETISPEVLKLIGEWIATTAPRM